MQKSNDPVSNEEPSGASSSGECPTLCPTQLATRVAELEAKLQRADELLAEAETDKEGEMRLRLEMTGQRDEARLEAERLRDYAQPTTWLPWESQEVSGG